MSVTLRHINADATFLITFSPELHPSPSDLKSANGAYSILCDPWVSAKGSVVNRPWFAITTRLAPASIGHLSELEEPDVVLISQNKPDHCHKDTLLQLRPEGKTIIVAEPGAAKWIKGWNHFDPNRVHGLKKYDARARFGNSFRIRIPPLSPAGHAGEVNISFIPAKNYVTGLHNAYGITYKAPTHVQTHAHVSTVDLPQYFNMPLSPATLPPSSPPPPLSPMIVRPMTAGYETREPMGFPRPQISGARGHRPQLSRASATASSEFLPLSQHPASPAPPTPSLTIEDLPSPRPSDTATSPTLNIPFSFENDADGSHFNKNPTPSTCPLSPSSFTSPHSSVSSSSNFNATSTTTTVTSPNPSISFSSLPVHPARPKPVSVLFAPHGLPLADLKPYVQTHLVRASALPLTVLLHAFDHSQNPFYLGGNIMTGANGGVQIARALMARCWVSAHDEFKDERGLATRRLRITQRTAEEVRRKLLEGDEGEWLRKQGWSCDVRSLEVGGEMSVSGAGRDRSAGTAKGQEHDGPLVGLGVGV